jgi:serine/threonine-protein kinase
LRHGEFKAGELIPGTRYRVLGLLGAGGMGTVYEVEHTELGKRFVLKALLSDLSRREDLVARLRNEQRALGRLEHPSIVNVTDAGVTTTNVPYFVMERLDGETLGARLKRAGCLPIGEALEIAASVLDGLAAAHEIGVVHRVVKPQNIFLAHGKYPKILDFGVAKVADTGSAITARGVAVGTPRYMSPEQASGEKLDGRSDLYAVGLLLYEMLVGKGPFDDARDANEMLLAHLSHAPPRLSSRAGSVTHDLDEFVASLLAKSPAARPPTARDAAAVLRTLAVPYQRAPRDAVGHARTVRLAERFEPAVKTRADGVAARHAWSLREGTTEDAKTLARLPRSGPNDTLVDSAGPRGANTTHGGDATALADATLRDYAGTAPTTRTEILSVVDAPNAGDVETHTRVPVTPSDGSRTLDPVPLSRLPSVPPPDVRRTRIVAALAFALAAGVGSFVYAVAHGPPAREATAAAEPRRAPVRPAPDIGAAATPEVSAPVVPARVTAAANAPAAEASSPGAAATAAATASAAPQKPKKSAKRRVTAPRIPDGLPSSGL